MLSNFVLMKRMINRYVLLVSAVFLVAVTSCVPAKKYQDLLAREKACNEELEKYKNTSSQAENKAQIVEEKLNLLEKEVDQLKKDTLSNGAKFRSSLLELAKLKKQYADLEKSFDNYKQMGSKEASVFQAELEAKSIELQRKEDALAILEKELNAKQALLAEREARVAELEEIIARQDRGMKLLKEKIAAALQQQRQARRASNKTRRQ